MALLDPPGYDPSVVGAISHVVHVKRVERSSFVNLLPLGSDGAPTDTPKLSSLASIDGLGFGVDRLAVAHGRMANPRRAEEFVANADAARLLGMHLGEVVSFGAYTNDQTGLDGFGTAAVAPYFRVGIKLVGIVVGNDAVVQISDPRKTRLQTGHRPREGCS